MANCRGAREWGQVRVFTQPGPTPRCPYVCASAESTCSFLSPSPRSSAPFTNVQRAERAETLKGRNSRTNRRSGMKQKAISLARASALLFYCRFRGQLRSNVAIVQTRKLPGRRTLPSLPSYSRRNRLDFPRLFFYCRTRRKAMPIKSLRNRHVGNSISRAIINESTPLFYCCKYLANV